MRLKVQAVLSISLLTRLLSACTSYSPELPSTPPPSALAEVMAEVMAKKSDEDLCSNISTMAFSIVISRQLLALDKKLLVRDTKKDYPGFDSTIESMANEAFKQDQKSSIAKANEMATKFQNKWTTDLGVCESTLNKLST